MNAMSDDQVVQHVLRNRANYYRILMIERTATVDQVKVAYKKMALKCHPDKNKHAQAADAFKLVGSAHTTLSDATKRRIYDRAGTEGVQRHESGGGRGGGGGGGAPAGARYRHNAQRDFFEEFFGGAAFYQQQQYRQGPQRGQPQYQQQHGAHHMEFEINPNLLMLIPVFIFLLLALVLQSGLTDVNQYSGGGTGGGIHRTVSPASAAGRPTSAATGFSLTPSPEEGYVLKRTTSLHGLHVPYYTTRRWADVLERRRDVLLSTEQEVLRSQRDYLANRCEAETFKHRTRGRRDAPEVCSEYHRFRRALG